MSNKEIHKRNHSITIHKKIMTEQRSHYNQLKSLLNKYFTIPELEDLCFALGIDNENFSITKSIKSNFTLEIVDYCRRYGRECDLVEYLNRNRSHLQDELAPLTQVFCNQPPTNQIGTTSKKRQFTFFWGNFRLNISRNLAVFLTVIFIIIITFIFVIKNSLPTWPLEPNDSAVTAALILPDIVYTEGLDDENDWYQIRLREKSSVQAIVQNFQGVGQLVLYSIDGQGNRTIIANDGRGSTKMSVPTGEEPNALHCLEPGVYLLRVYSTEIHKPIQIYELKVQLISCQ